MLLENNEVRHRHTSGASYLTTDRASAMGSGRQGGAESYNSYKRYNHRSRSELGSPRRYASQTLLDGPRPGPSAGPHNRNDAVQNLQRELDSLSRSPVAAGGYSSDTSHMESSRSRGARAFDYGIFTITTSGFLFGNTLAFFHCQIFLSFPMTVANLIFSADSTFQSSSHQSDVKEGDSNIVSPSSAISSQQHVGGGEEPPVGQHQGTHLYIIIIKSLLTHAHSI